MLALTGLNVMYGKYFLLPLIGQGAFASLTSHGKVTHNYIAFAFMLGVVMMFVLWVRHNIIDGTDFNWIAKGGGMFSKGVHPPAKRFNFGQKIIFWFVVLGGLTMSVSGLALLFPFEISPWAETFAVMNIFGFGLPTDLTLLQETQLSVLWHGVVALIMITIIIGHIYIGTPVGMEGAIGAVGSGQVDVNGPGSTTACGPPKLKARRPRNRKQANNQRNKPPAQWFHLNDQGGLPENGGRLYLVFFSATAMCSLFWSLRHTTIGRHRIALGVG